MQGSGSESTGSKKTWRIEVDASRCIGSGSCVALARHQFVLTAQHCSEALRHVTDPDAAVLDAARSCPVDAIAIIETDGARVTRLAG